MSWAFLAYWLPILSWPYYLLLPLLAYTSVALLIPQMRQTMPWPRTGRPDCIGILAAFILSVATAGVLLLYQSLEQPDVSALAAGLPMAEHGNFVVAALCFCFINASLEELIFRGILFEAFAAEWGIAFAVAVTAAFFGFCHLQGYPPGPPGAILAGLYGLALGLLRWWSGGLLLAITCHATADAVIFAIVVAN
jgi:membrane protease YdiL (CAAX protease family)